MASVISAQTRMRAPTSPPPTRLLELADAIEGALDLDPMRKKTRVLEALYSAVMAERWLPSERRRANHEHYARHLLYGDPGGRFSILAIVWDQGQASPRHGHYTWCAVGVYDNELMETTYKDLGDGQLQELGVAVRKQGSCTFSEPLSEVHMIHNHSPTPTVSLHIYGVAADRVGLDINKIYR